MKNTGWIFVAILAGSLGYYFYSKKQGKAISSEPKPSASEPEPSLLDELSNLAEPKPQPDTGPKPGVSVHTPVEPEPPANSPVVPDVPEKEYLLKYKILIGGYKEAKEINVKNLPLRITGTIRGTNDTFWLELDLGDNCINVIGKVANETIIGTIKLSGGTVSGRYFTSTGRIMYSIYAEVVEV